MCISVQKSSFPRGAQKCLETGETTKSLEYGKCLETRKAKPSVGSFFLLIFVRKGSDILFLAQEKWPKLGNSHNHCNCCMIILGTRFDKDNLS